MMLQCCVRNSFCLKIWRPNYNFWSLFTLHIHKRVDVTLIWHSIMNFDLVVASFHSNLFPLVGFINSHWNLYSQELFQTFVTNFANYSLLTSVKHSKKRHWIKKFPTFKTLRPPRMKVLTRLTSSELKIHATQNRQNNVCVIVVKYSSNVVVVAVVYVKVHRNIHAVLVSCFFC